MEGSLGTDARAFVAAALRSTQQRDWRSVAQHAKELWAKRSKARGW